MSLQAFQKLIEPTGITITTEQRYARSDTSVQAQVLRILATKPDAILVGGSGSQAALPGITRQSVTTLCNDLCIPVAEQMIPREMLYVADEVFLCGTAAEITPIRSVDRIKVGSGSRGPFTKRVQDEFFAITSGTKPDRYGWLSPVGVSTGAGVR